MSKGCKMYLLAPFRSQMYLPSTINSRAHYGYLACPAYLWSNSSEMNAKSTHDQSLLKAELLTEEIKWTYVIMSSTVSFTLWIKAFTATWDQTSQVRSLQNMFDLIFCPVFLYQSGCREKKSQCCDCVIHSLLLNFTKIVSFFYV